MSSASSNFPSHTGNGDLGRPKGTIGDFRCTHTCRCLCITTSDGRARHKLLDSHQTHVANGLSHPSCTDFCPGFGLLTTKPHTFKATERGPGPETLMVDGLSQMSKPSASAQTEIMKPPTVKSTMAAPQFTTRTVQFETEADKRKDPQKPVNQNVPDDDDEEIVILHVKIRCVHTCRCFRRPLNDRNEPTYDTFGSAPEAQIHVKSRLKHPRCTRSCPGYEHIRHHLASRQSEPEIVKAKRETKDDDISLLFMDTDEDNNKTPEVPRPHLKKTHFGRAYDDRSGGSAWTPLPQHEEGESEVEEDDYDDDDDDDDYDRNSGGFKNYKCSHICRCDGSTCSISAFDGKTFKTAIGAKRHIAVASKHPYCKPSCPAYKWLGPKYRNVEPLVIYTNKPNPEKNGQESMRQIGLKRAGEREDGERFTPRPTKKSRFEPLNTPSHPLRFSPTSASTSRAHMIFSLSPSPGATDITLAAETTPQAPAPSSSTSITRKLASSTMTTRRNDLAPPPFIRPIDTTLTEQGLLTQHYSVLIELSNKLSDVLSEFRALSKRLYLLPFVTPDYMHFATSDISSLASASDVADSFLSAMSRMLHTVTKMHDALQEMLLVNDPEGLLEIQQFAMRELRRRVAVLKDHLVDLQLDLQQANNNGMEGIKEKGRAKDWTQNISGDITEISSKMEDLMTQTLERLALYM